MTALVLVGALAVGGGQPGPGVLRDAAVAVFPAALHRSAARRPCRVRAMGGRAAILVLLVVMVVSDSAQYYTGRTFGRRPLAPSISPKKTVEGAVGGLIFGTAAMIGCRTPGVRRASSPAARDSWRNRRRARHRRRSVRVAAQTERRREGLVGVDSRPRRRARSDSTAGCSRRRPTTCSSATFNEIDRDSRFDGLDRAERARGRRRASGSSARRGAGGGRKCREVRRRRSGGIVRRAWRWRRRRRSADARASLDS